MSKVIEGRKELEDVDVVMNDVAVGDLVKNVDVVVNVDVPVIQAAPVVAPDVQLCVSSRAGRRLKKSAKLLSE